MARCTTTDGSGEVAATTVRRGATLERPADGAARRCTSDTLAGVPAAASAGERRMLGWLAKTAEGGPTETMGRAPVGSGVRFPAGADLDAGEAERSATRRSSVGVVISLIAAGIRRIGASGDSWVGISAAGIPA